LSTVEFEIVDFVSGPFPDAENREIVKIRIIITTNLCKCPAMDKIRCPNCNKSIASL